MRPEERRSFVIDRATSTSVAGATRFHGHAAVFGQRTWIGPSPEHGFWEEVAQGAFDRALAEDDVRFLIEHDPRWILGRSSAGTLHLATDRAGLAVEATFPQTSYAADVAESLSRGDLSGMSFAFTVRDGGDDVRVLKDGSMLRTLSDLKLWDVSIVAWPAYEGTEADVRAVEARRSEFRTEHRDAARRRLETIRRSFR